MAQLASAQWFFLWKGDYRMALDAGMNMSLYKVKFVGPLADHIVDDVKPAISPTIGFYSGMEKDINKKTAFGFYADFQVYQTHWSVSFGENSSNNVLYKVKSTTLNMMQGVYFAFDIKKMKRKKLQAMGGLGIYEDLRFKGKINEEIKGDGYATVLDSAYINSLEYLMDSHLGMDVPFSLDFGLSFIAGVQYRFNENFFVSGRIVYMLPLFGSGSTIDDWSSSMTGSTSSSNDRSTSKLNDYVEYQNDKINRIGIVGTIGFRF